jgi:PAS domain-containing protein
MPKKLPLGLQDFRKIIENGFLYVDKTEYVFRIASNPGAYFLSRPRRFGKSITVAILHELYSGSRELFQGLWIEDKWDWNKKHPVLRLSLTSIGFQSIGLRPALLQEISLIAEAQGITLKSEGLAARFRELIGAMAAGGHKTVVLVDEYDAPILHYLGTKLEQAVENREVLREFYTVLKDCDTLLELVFLTGVSKFSKTGIFSGLNNLVDLSMHPAFATMLGYTQEELESNFSEEIEAAAVALQLPRPQLLDKMREWYNGYRFEEHAPRVYNPVSVNNFFSRNKFENFWFATGTPSFLVNLLRKEGIFDLNLPAINPGGFETFELDRLKPEAILFQTGYLTIQGLTEDGLIQLAYPNKEVRDSMLEVLIEGFLAVDVERSAYLVIRLRNAFRENDVDKAMEILQGVFANLPYFLHEKYPEKFFHAAIHLLFTYMGIRIHSEACTSEGRVDSLVETDTHVYILEYKLDKSPQEAIEQIRRKRYYQAAWHLGKPVIAVGVSFSSQTKNIESWATEEMQA